jgi:hypothetical protein
MNVSLFIISIISIITSFLFHLLGLMNLAPLIITTPLLFFTIFIFFMMINNHKRFRGFK